MHRFGGTIATRAAAVQNGDGASVVEVLRGERADVTWVDTDAASADAADVRAVRTAVVGAGEALTTATLAGDGRAAFDALGTFRLLCSHRRGPYGVSTWTSRVEGWLEADVDGFASVDGWYPGRPLLFTENYGLGLYNGDTGVVVAAGDGSGVFAVFERADSSATQVRSDFVRSSVRILLRTRGVCCVVGGDVPCAGRQQAV